MATVRQMWVTSCIEFQATNGESEWRWLLQTSSWLPYQIMNYGIWCHCFSHFLQGTEMAVYGSFSWPFVSVWAVHFNHINFRFRNSEFLPFFFFLNHHISHLPFLYIEVLPTNKRRDETKKREHYCELNIIVNSREILAKKKTRVDAAQYSCCEFSKTPWRGKAQKVEELLTMKLI